jgi:hypothetical protein
MHEVTWISFDHTVPVPVLRDGYLVARDDIKLLLTDEFNVFKWEKDRVHVLWRDFADTGQDIVWNDEEADVLERVDVEGVEFFRIGTAPFQFNDDTEQMLELGYRAYFVPGGGIVVDNPATPVTQAADRIFEDLRGIFGMYAPERLNSWAEYAAVVPNLDRVFALAGVERHEKEKQAAVAARVDVWLAARAAGLPTESTVRADEMAVNTVLEATDVRWWSHSPERELFVVTKIEPAENGMLAVTTETKYGHERTRLVRPDRRFLVAAQKENS